jgi:glucosamine--fructose-6-phosphate aminotransferase (isomerizing)
VGEEQAVAATKSYLATLSALLQLVAHWKDEANLLAQVEQLPEILAQTTREKQQLLPAHLGGVEHLVVMGRGFGYALAREVALKLKEVCGIQAESFSSAEFLHGPVTLVEGGLTMVSLAINDESASSHQQQVDEVIRRGAQVHTLTQSKANLPSRLAPLTLLQRFYIDVAVIAVAFGLDPDSPAGLNKVTKTL